MPEMTGGQMLDLIRQIAPATVRVLLSSHVGHAERLGPAHLHLGKPCSLPALETTVRHALAAQEALQNPELARLVASLRRFPVLPSACADVLRELDNDDSTLDQTAEPSGRDGGGFTGIVQGGDSALFGGVGGANVPRTALVELGTRNAKALAVATCVFKACRGPHVPEMPVDLLWRHSCSAAKLARELCRKSLGEGPAGDAFFAGLIHELGCLVLMKNDAEAFRALCQEAQREGKSLRQAERERFHAAHEELSVFILRLWGIPEPVVEAVAWHNIPWEGPHPERFSPTVALYMANIITRQWRPPDKLLTPPLDREYLESVGAPTPCPSTRYGDGAGFAGTASDGL